MPRKYQETTFPGFVRRWFESEGGLVSAIKNSDGTCAVKFFLHEDQSLRGAAKVADFAEAVTAAAGWLAGKPRDGADAEEEQN